MFRLTDLNNHLAKTVDRLKYTLFLSTIYHTGTRVRVKLEKVSVFTYSLQTLLRRVKADISTNHTKRTKNEVS